MSEVPLYQESRGLLNCQGARFLLNCCVACFLQGYLARFEQGYLAVYSSAVWRARTGAAECGGLGRAAVDRRVQDRLHGGTTLPTRQKSRVERLKAKVEPLSTYVSISRICFNEGLVKNKLASVRGSGFRDLRFRG